MAESHDLTGRVVLVTGATGHVGWGIAHAVLEAGGRVILSSRSADGAATLRAEFDGQEVLEADASAPGFSAPLEEAVVRTGRLDHVVAPMGSWWQKGPTLEQPAGELDALLDTYVAGQLSLVRASEPFLSDAGGSYTLISGAAGEGSVPGGGLLVVAVRAQYALADVLRRELEGAPFRFNELRIATRIEREERAGVVPSRTAGGHFLPLLTGEVRSERIRYEGGPLPTTDLRRS